MEVLVLDQSHYTRPAVMPDSAKPYSVQEQCFFAEATKYKPFSKFLMGLWVVALAETQKVRSQFVHPNIILGRMDRILSAMIRLEK